MTQQFKAPEDTFRFGKYKGATLSAVVEKDSGYIVWALENNVITLTDKAFVFWDDLGMEMDNMASQKPIRQRTMKGRRFGHSHEADEETNDNWYDDLDWSDWPF